MPRSNLFSDDPTSHHRGAHPEPALSQLRRCSTLTLDRIVSGWLQALTYSAPRVIHRASGVTTYQALLQTPTLCLPILVRVYQRKNRLQVHHVDAFAGTLHRLGIAQGVLITTGRCAREAVQLTPTLNNPKVRIVCGVEWVNALALARIGVQHKSLRHLVLDWLRHRDC